MFRISVFFFIVLFMTLLKISQVFIWHFIFKKVIMHGHFRCKCKCYLYSSVPTKGKKKSQWFSPFMAVIPFLGFPGGMPVVKNLPANAGVTGDWGDSWVQKIPWRRKWQLTLVFLSEKSHRQRSLEGYSPWACKRVEHNLATRQQQTNKKNFWKKTARHLENKYKYL